MFIAKDVTVTVVGHAGPLSVGYVPGKVWVCGAFLTPDEADLHADYTHKAAEQARSEEPAAEHPVDPGKFL